MERTYWIGLVFSLIVLIAVFFRMRNAGMKERYATWWVVIVVGTTIVSLFPSLLSLVSGALGVRVPLNLAFFVEGIVMMLVSLQLSVDASRGDEERRRLVEEIAILNLRMEQLEAGSSGSSDSSDSSGSAGAADSPRAALCGIPPAPLPLDTSHTPHSVYTALHHRVAEPISRPHVA